MFVVVGLFLHITVARAATENTASGFQKSRGARDPPPPKKCSLGSVIVLLFFINH